MNNIKSQVPSFRGLYLAGDNKTEKEFTTAEAINNYTNSNTGMDLFASDKDIIDMNLNPSPIPSKIVASHRIDATVSFVDPPKKNENDSFIKVSIKDTDNNIGIGTIMLTKGSKSLNYLVEDNKGKLFEQSSKPIKNSGPAIVKLIDDVTSRLIQTKAKGVAQDVSKKWQTLQQSITASIAQIGSGETNKEKIVSELSRDIQQVNSNFQVAIKTINEHQGF